MINQKIKHEKLDDIPPIMRRINKKDKYIFEFVYDYLKTHRFSSKNMVSSICVDEFYPNKPNTIDYNKLKRGFKRKISDFFSLLIKLGIATQFNTTTITVDFEKLKKYTLNDILSYTKK